MDLILWRHAEAEDPRDGQEDAARSLTARGERQAARVAAWLDRQLPEGTKILSSPARRCEQTVLALGRRFKMRDELGPGATVAGLLEVVQWPVARQPVVVVGHQPVIGETIAHLLGIAAGSCAVRKGAAWWLRTRERAGDAQCVVVAVQSPDAP